MVWRDLSKNLDVSVLLKPCPFCATQAGFRRDEHKDIRAECSNGACAVATPYHYKTEAVAAVAWNRRS